MSNGESRERKPLTGAEIAEKRETLTGAGVESSAKNPPLVSVGNLTREIFGISSENRLKMTAYRAWCGSGSGSGSGSGTGSGTGTGSGSGWI